jgi:undecaprenyl-diphosphatase
MGFAWQRLWRGSRPEAWLLCSAFAIAGLLLAFGLIAAEVIEGEPLAVDRAILLLFRDRVHGAAPLGPAWLQSAARDVTALGSHTVIGIVVFTVAGYFVLARQRASAWLVLGAVIGGVVLNNLLKTGFDRPRPDSVSHAVQVFTPSFPSGHATLSAITYLTVGALLARLHPCHKMPSFFMLIALAVTALVGISRIYLGVHYPTDVLAGWCLGSAWALVCWSLATWLEGRQRSRPAEQP